MESEGNVQGSVIISFFFINLWDRFIMLDEESEELKVVCFWFGFRVFKLILDSEKNGKMGVIGSVFFINLWDIFYSEEELILEVISLWYSFKIWDKDFQKFSMLKNEKNV